MSRASKASIARRSKSAWRKGGREWESRLYCAVLSSIMFRWYAVLKSFSVGIYGFEVEVVKDAAVVEQKEA